MTGTSKWPRGRVAASTSRTAAASMAAALAACASLTAACAGPAPGGGVTAPVPPGALGALPPRIVEAATTYAGAFEVRLRADATGAVTKHAVYHADESRVPAAVRALAAKELPDGKIRHYELELYSDIGWVHEVELVMPDGRHCEVSAREDGTLVYVERAMLPTELPAAIAAAVKALLPDGVVVEIESKKGPGLDVVHVEVKAGALVHYLRFAPTGERLGHWLRIPAVVEFAL